MLISEISLPNSLNKNDFENLGPVSIAGALRHTFGHKSEQFQNLKIVEYRSSHDYMAHMASQIAVSDVVNDDKWSELYYYAKDDLNDENLESTFIDDVKLNLIENLKLIKDYIKAFQFKPIAPNDDSVYFAFDDQESLPEFNVYQLFIINEISRAVEENRKSFLDLSGKTLLVVIINKMLSYSLNEMVEKCHSLIINTKCHLLEVAESNHLEWNGEFWECDN